ncbi:DUF1446 domain-containing protein [Eubacteriales bacterium OttesenSCG-928-A19]|nr:DUF1446 domain-containing protein [Eubacteriales bacterium OttesenSCG-928-A19]
MRTLRIGSGAGYSGDRLTPAIDLMRHGRLDYIIFECLAERTIALAQRQRLKDPDQGYDPFFLRRMEAILDAMRDRRPRVITNMGAANPTAAAKAAAEMARARGLHGLKIAAVTGDDILGRLDRYMDTPVIETGRPLRELSADIVSANAYIGCRGIVEALESGADIVITGRVADPSLTLAALVHEFGWRMDDYPMLGRGTLAGHLLECAGQITGGYFCDPSVKDVPDLWNLGFPIAEISEDGTLVITKLDGTGGLVTEQTCKEQIIYELQDPAAYMTPDCTADFHLTSVRQLEKDRVRVSGATGREGNHRYKASIGYRNCWIGEGQISYGGSTAYARARLAGEVIEKRLAPLAGAIEELRIDYIGVDSLLHGDRPTSGVHDEVRLRVAARTPDRHAAECIGEEVEALYTNGPAGGGGVTKSAREIVSIASILIPKDEVTTHVEYWEV